MTNAYKQPDMLTIWWAHRAWMFRHTVYNTTVSTNADITPYNIVEQH